GALAGSLRELPPGRRPEDWRTETDESSDGSPRCAETPLDAPVAEEVRRPLHYKVQFTASQEFVDLLEEARSLLAHERSGTELPDVHVRALRALVKELR